MKLQHFFCFFLFILSILTLSAQSKAGTLNATQLERIEPLEDTLGALAFIILRDTNRENRFAACRKFIPTLTKTLKTKNSFSYPFEQLTSISILYPPDSSFRVFSWQLYVDVNEYHYYGAIQMNNEELELHPLVDRSREKAFYESQGFTPDSWYGVVYYNLKQFDSPNGSKYLLFGYDAFELFNHRKVLEVLHFENGQPIFGAPVLAEVNPDGEVVSTKQRLMLEYSAEASIRLNFDPALDMIIFDHLITVGGSYPGQGPTQVPDGSYCGYKLENGQWVYIEKVFNQVLDEAPREFPVLDGRKGKDIFGN